MGKRSFFIGIFALVFVAAQVGATADYRAVPEFTAQWDVPHVGESVPLLLIDATDDDEVHVLDHFDKTFFEYEDDGELEDSWDEFGCVTFPEARNLAVDHHENVFVLEYGSLGKLHRFSEDYFEEYCDDEFEPESTDDDTEEDEEDEEVDEDVDLPGALSWDVINGTDVAVAPGHAFVIGTNKLIRIVFATDEITEIAMESNVSVATDKDGNVYVLTNGGHKIKKFNSDLEFLSEKKLGVYANDIDVDRRGNVYVARSDGYIKQYNRDYGLLNALTLPLDVEPGQLSMSFDGDLFVTGINTSTIYHFDFPDIPEPKKKDRAIYRFYSKVYKGHFYTSSYAEAKAISEEDENWAYENVAYKYVDAADENASTVYRFYSENYKHHFYTSNKKEKETIEANDPNWAYEGEAYNVYAAQQPGSTPIHRFYSATYQGHFYTSSESEKEHIEANDPNWAYEGIAWWVIEE